MKGKVENDRKISKKCWYRKICFTKSIDEIEDPWYTGGYEKVVQELRICLEDILERLL